MTKDLTGELQRLSDKQQEDEQLSGYVAIDPQQISSVYGARDEFIEMAATLEYVVPIEVLIEVTQKAMLRGITVSEYIKSAVARLLVQDGSDPMTVANYESAANTRLVAHPPLDIHAESLATRLDLFSGSLAAKAPMGWRR